MLFGTQSQPIDVGNTCVRDYVDSEDRISELVKIKDAVALFQRTKRCRHQPTIDDIGKGKKKVSWPNAISSFFFVRFQRKTQRRGSQGNGREGRGLLRMFFFFLVVVVVFIVEVSAFWFSFRLVLSILELDATGTESVVHFFIFWGFFFAMKVSSFDLESQSMHSIRKGADDFFLRSTIDRRPSTEEYLSILSYLVAFFPSFGRWCGDGQSWGARSK